MLPTPSSVFLHHASKFPTPHPLSLPHPFSLSSSTPSKTSSLHRFSHLFTQGPTFHSTKLHFAVSSADINLLNQIYNSIALQLHQTKLNNPQDFLFTLFDATHLLNYQDTHKQTPLSLALSRQKIDILQQLLHTDKISPPLSSSPLLPYLRLLPKLLIWKCPCHQWDSSPLTDTQQILHKICSTELNTRQESFLGFLEGFLSSQELLAHFSQVLFLPSSSPLFKESLKKIYSEMLSLFLSRHLGLLDIKVPLGLVETMFAPETICSLSPLAPISSLSPLSPGFHPVFSPYSFFSCFLQGFFLSPAQVLSFLTGSNRHLDAFSMEGEIFASSASPLHGAQGFTEALYEVLLLHLVKKSAAEVRRPRGLRGGVERDEEVPLPSSCSAFVYFLKSQVESERSRLSFLDIFSWGDERKGEKRAGTHRGQERRREEGGGEERGGEERRERFPRPKVDCIPFLLLFKRFQVIFLRLWSHTVLSAEGTILGESFESKEKSFVSQKESLVSFLADDFFSSLLHLRVLEPVLHLSFVQDKSHAGTTHQSQNKGGRGELREMREKGEMGEKAEKAEREQTVMESRERIRNLFSEIHQQKILSRREMSPPHSETKSQAKGIALSRPFTTQRRELPKTGLFARGERKEERRGEEREEEGREEERSVEERRGEERRIPNYVKFYLQSKKFSYSFLSQEGQGKSVFYNLLALLFFYFPFYKSKYPSQIISEETSYLLEKHLSKTVLSSLFSPPLLSISLRIPSLPSSIVSLPPLSVLSPSSPVSSPSPSPQRSPLPEASQVHPTCVEAWYEALKASQKEPQTSFVLKTSLFLDKGEENAFALFLSSKELMMDAGKESFGREERRKSNPFLEREKVMKKVPSFASPLLSSPSLSPASSHTSLSPSSLSFFSHFSPVSRLSYPSLPFFPTGTEKGEESLREAFRRPGTSQRENPLAVPVESREASSNQGGVNPFSRLSHVMGEKERSLSPLSSLFKSRDLQEEEEDLSRLERVFEEETWQARREEERIGEEKRGVKWREEEEEWRVGEREEQRGETWREETRREEEFDVDNENLSQAFQKLSFIADAINPPHLPTLSPSVASPSLSSLLPTPVFSPPFYPSEEKAINEVPNSAISSNLPLHEDSPSSVDQKTNDSVLNSVGEIDTAKIAANITYEYSSPAIGVPESPDLPNPSWLLQVEEEGEEERRGEERGGAETKEGERRREEMEGDEIKREEWSEGEGSNKVRKDEETWEEDRRGEERREEEGQEEALNEAVKHRSEESGDIGHMKRRDSKKTEDGMEEGFFDEEEKIKMSIDIPTYQPKSKRNNLDGIKEFSPMVNMTMDFNDF